MGYLDHLSDDELLETVCPPDLGPAPGRGANPAPLRLTRGGDEDGPLLPDASAAAEIQHADAVHRLFEDARDYPRFPWARVDEMAGAMAPEDLWVLAGRTGGGKSLFLLNLFDGLVAAGRTVLYLGLEQGPKILRAKWSCLRLGVDPRLVLAPRAAEYGTPAHLAARTRVLEDMRDFQMAAGVREHAHFAAERFVDRAALVRWARGAAAEYGAQVGIVDHVDRVHHGDGRNSFHEISETVRLAKELAATLRITMLLASQVGRPHDRAERFMPPSLHDLRGAGTKEEEADAVLGVFRPLRSDLPAKELAAKLTAVRQGTAEELEVYQPDTMAVRVLKHRLDGANALGRQEVLRVERGRLRGRWDP